MDQIHWNPGEWGKGLIRVPENEVHTWNTDRAKGSPHHTDYLKRVPGCGGKISEMASSVFIQPDGTLIPVNHEDNKVNELYDLYEKADPRLKKNEMQSWVFGKTSQHLTPPAFVPWTNGKPGKGYVSGGQVYAWDATKAIGTHHYDALEAVSGKPVGGRSPKDFHCFHIVGDQLLNSMGDPAAIDQASEALGIPVKQDNWTFGKTSATQVPPGGLPWEPGHPGKGVVLGNQVYAWDDAEDSPELHHDEVLDDLDATAPPEAMLKAMFFIHPSGGITEGYSIDKGWTPKQIAKCDPRWTAKPGWSFNAKTADLEPGPGNHVINWQPGGWGKGIIFRNSDVHTWNTSADQTPWMAEDDGKPFHSDYVDGLDPEIRKSVGRSEQHFVINPDGEATVSKHYMPVINKADPRLRGTDRWTFGSANEQPEFIHHDIDPAEGLNAGGPEEDGWGGRIPIIYHQDTHTIHTGPADIAHHDVINRAQKSGYNMGGPVNYGWVGYNPEAAERGMPWSHENYGWYDSAPSDQVNKAIRSHFGIKPMEDAPDDMSQWKFGGPRTKTASPVLPSLAELHQQAQQTGGRVLYHGGLPDHTNMDTIDLNRGGTQQNKRNRSYGGFYMTDHTSLPWSQQYAQERGGNLHGFLLHPHAKVMDLGAQNIDRLNLEQRKQYAQTHDVVQGKDTLGRSQYALLNKGAVAQMGHERYQPKVVGKFGATPFRPFRPTMSPMTEPSSWDDEDANAYGVSRQWHFGVNEQGTVIHPVPGLEPWAPGRHGKALYYPEHDEAHIWAPTVPGSEEGDYDEERFDAHDYDGQPAHHGVDKYRARDLGFGNYKSLVISPEGKVSGLDTYEDADPRAVSVVANAIGGTPTERGWYFGSKVSQDINHDDYYWHWAPASQRNRIQAHGLHPAYPGQSERYDGGEVPQSEVTQPTGVYALRDYKTAWHGQNVPRIWGGRAADLWRIPRNQIRNEINDPQSPRSTAVITHPVHAELHSNTRDHPDAFMADPKAYQWESERHPETMPQHDKMKNIYPMNQVNPLKDRGTFASTLATVLSEAATGFSKAIERSTLSNPPTDGDTKRRSDFRGQDRAMKHHGWQDASEDIDHALPYRDGMPWKGLTMKDGRRYRWGVNEHAEPHHYDAVDALELTKLHDRVQIYHDSTAGDTETGQWKFGATEWQTPEQTRPYVDDRDYDGKPLADFKGLTMKDGRKYRWTVDRRGAPSHPEVLAGNNLSASDVDTFHDSRQQTEPGETMPWRFGSSEWQTPEGYEPPNDEDEDFWKGLTLKDGRRYRWFSGRMDTNHADVMIDHNIRPEEVERYHDGAYPKAYYPYADRTLEDQQFYMDKTQDGRESPGYKKRQEQKQWKFGTASKATSKVTPDLPNNADSSQSKMTQVDKSSNERVGLFGRKPKMGRGLVMNDGSIRSWVSEDPNHIFHDDYIAEHRIDEKRDVATRWRMHPDSLLEIDKNPAEHWPGVYKHVKKTFGVDSLPTHLGYDPRKFGSNQMSDAERYEVLTPQINLAQPDPKCMTGKTQAVTDLREQYGENEYHKERDMNRADMARLPQRDMRNSSDLMINQLPPTTTPHDNSWQFTRNSSPISEQLTSYASQNIPGYSLTDLGRSELMHRIGSDLSDLGYPDWDDFPIDEDRNEEMKRRIRNNTTYKTGMPGKFLVRPNGDVHHWVTDDGWPHHGEYAIEHCPKQWETEKSEGYQPSAYGVIRPNGTYWYDGPKELADIAGSKLGLSDTSDRWAFGSVGDTNGESGPSFKGGSFTGMLDHLRTDQAGNFIEQADLPREGRSENLKLIQRHTASPLAPSVRVHTGEYPEWRKGDPDGVSDPMPPSGSRAMIYDENTGTLHIGDHDEVHHGDMWPHISPTGGFPGWVNMESKEHQWYDERMTPEHKINANSLLTSHMGPTKDMDGDGWKFGSGPSVRLPEEVKELTVKEQDLDPDPDPILAALIEQNKTMQEAILELTSKVSSQAQAQPQSRKLVIHRDKDNRMSEIEEVMI